jgi:tetrapyrrole methylase family protein/MazG family protein
MLSLVDVVHAIEIDPVVVGLYVIAQKDQELKPQTPTIIVLPRVQKELMLRSIKQQYPLDVEIVGIDDVGSTLKWRLSELDVNRFAECQFIFIQAVSWENDLRNFDALLRIVEHLRAPDGCPWDREQTHESLGQYLLEETYEALEELDKGNIEEFSKELGDVLLQIVLHSQIGNEVHKFDISDVILAINEKLIRRHPHVFGDAQVETKEEVLANWEILKSQERGGASLMEGVPSSLPALSYGQRVQERASGIGFDWDHIQDVEIKIREELEEFINASSIKDQELEFGDILFTLVNLGRHLDFDVERSLRQANAKFVERFQLMEKLADETGVNLPNLAIEEKEEIWRKVKDLESR